MSTPQGSAAPGSGFANDDIPNFDEITDDPEIAALLDFEPVPRKIKRPNTWTPALQRRLIAKLAELGSPAKACEALGGRDRYGAEKLYRGEEAEEFRTAWDAAIALFEERDAKRKEEHSAQWQGVRPPGGIDKRLGENHRASASGDGPLPGQVMNEYGEWEDEDSYLRRAEEAKDSIRGKLLRARRLYLQEISDCPGKRAAFEILTRLPIDWEKAARLEPQDDEPWARTNQRQPDMILTAESGWSAGEIGYGPDRKAEMRKAIDEYRAAEGLEPVDWDGE